MRPGSAVSLARVAELSKPTKLNTPKVSADVTPLRLRCEGESWIGSMIVPCRTVTTAMMAMMIAIEIPSIMSPMRDENLMSR